MRARVKCLAAIWAVAMVTKAIPAVAIGLAVPAYWKHQSVRRLIHFDDNKLKEVKPVFSVAIT